MHPEIPVLCFVSVTLSLAPLFWYLRARNIAALAIGIWLSITNLTYAVNALAWAENADIKASVWCDICKLVPQSSAYPTTDSCKQRVLLRARVLRYPQRAFPSVSILNVWLPSVKPRHPKRNSDALYSSALCVSDYLSCILLCVGLL